MLSGTPVVFSIDPFAEDSIQQHQLGALGFSSDGRKYRYALAGEALVAGHLLQASAERTSSENLAPAVAGVIGDMSVSVTCGEVRAANFFAEGYMVITTSTGYGHSYKIKSHPALTAAAYTFILEEPLKAALVVATSKIDLIANPYKSVVDNPASASAAPIGVAPFAVDSGYYFWAQSGGVANVLAQGTLTVGNLVVASNGTAGAVENAANASTEAQAVVGVAVTGVTTTQYGAINLLLA